MSKTYFSVLCYRTRDTECFAFLAGHESFAAAEGAIGIAEKANKVRQKPLRVILNGLGKDAAQIISRINGFTFVETEYDPYTNTVKEVFRKSYSDGLRAKVNCYGANDVCEGVAIMWKENVDVSITGNSTNPTRFQHPVAGTYKKERLEAGKKYFFNCVCVWIVFCLNKCESVDTGNDLCSVFSKTI